MTRPSDVEMKAATLVDDSTALTMSIGEPYETTDNDGNPVGIAEHIVAVTGVADKVGDVFVPGAFARAIRRNDVRPKGVSGHDWKRRVSKALVREEWMPGSREIRERVIPALPPTVQWPAAAGAIYVKVQYNLRTEAGREAYENAKFYGNEESFSVGWKPRPGGWKTRGGIRYITDLDWYEWSDVLHGAHPLAFGMATKGHPAEDGMCYTGSVLPQHLLDDLGDVEFKAGKLRYVRKPEYWGLPYGTPIRAGMEPVGSIARERRKAGKPVPKTAGLTDDPDNDDPDRPLDADELDAADDFLRGRAAGARRERAGVRSTERRAAVRAGDTETLARLDREAAEDRREELAAGVLANPLAYRQESQDVADEQRRSRTEKDITDARRAQAGRLAEALSGLSADERDRYLANLARSDDQLVTETREALTAGAGRGQGAGASAEAVDDFAETLGLMSADKRERTLAQLDKIDAATAQAVRAKLGATPPPADEPVVVQRATPTRGYAIPSTPATETAPEGAPDASALAKGNAEKRADALTQLSAEQLAWLHRTNDAEVTRLTKRRRVGEQGELKRRQNLQKSITSERVRRSRGEPPEFTDRAVLELISGENYDTGEIADHFGVKQPRALTALRRLEAAGYVTRNSGDGEGESVSGGRNSVSDLGWESAAGRDGDQAELLARYDRENPAKPAAAAPAAAAPVVPAIQQDGQSNADRLLDLARGLTIWEPGLTDAEPTSERAKTPPEIGELLDKLTPVERAYLRDRLNAELRQLYREVSPSGFGSAMESSIGRLERLDQLVQLGRAHDIEGLARAGASQQMRALADLDDDELSALVRVNATDTTTLRSRNRAPEKPMLERRTRLGNRARAEIANRSGAPTPTPTDLDDTSDSASPVDKLVSLVEGLDTWFPGPMVQGPNDRPAPPDVSDVINKLDAAQRAELLNRVSARTVEMFDRGQTGPGTNGDLIVDRLERLHELVTLGRAHDVEGLALRPRQEQDALLRRLDDDELIALDRVNSLDIGTLTTRGDSRAHLNRRTAFADAIRAEVDRRSAERRRAASVQPDASPATNRPADETVTDGPGVDAPDEPTAPRRERIITALTDYAPRYGGPNSPTPGPDNAARYTMEGHVPNSTPDETTWAADYLRAHPELLAAPALTDSQLAQRDRDRVVEADRLSNESAAAFKAGDYDTSERLIGEAAALDPSRATRWRMIRETIESDRRDAGRRDEREQAVDLDAPAAPVADKPEPAAPTVGEPAAKPAVDTSRMTPEQLWEHNSSGDPYAETPEMLAHNSATDNANDTAVERGFKDFSSEWFRVYADSFEMMLDQFEREAEHAAAAEVDDDEGVDEPSASPAGGTPPAPAGDADTIPLPDGRTLERGDLDEVERAFLLSRHILRDERGGVLAVVEQHDDGRWVWAAFREPYTTGEGAERDAVVAQLARHLGADEPAKRQPADPADAADTVDTIRSEEVAEAEQLRADALGLVEGDDGELEVTPEVAERQERVERLLAEQQDGSLTLSAQSADQLGDARVDVVGELRLQDEIARRDRAQKAAQAAGGPVDSGDEPAGGSDASPARDDGDESKPARKKREKPQHRPGVAGAAEDYADALDAGTDAEVTAAARARLDSSVRRSRSDSEHVAELRAMLDSGDPVTPERLRQLAGLIREEARERRNATARTRRRAKRLERERLRSLLAQIDAELRGRDLEPDAYGGPAPRSAEDIIAAPAAPAPAPVPPAVPGQPAQAERDGEAAFEEPLVDAGEISPDELAEAATLAEPVAEPAAVEPVDAEQQQANATLTRLHTMLLDATVGQSYSVAPPNGPARDVRVTAPAMRFATTDLGGAVSIEVSDAAGKHAMLRAAFGPDGRPELTYTPDNAVTGEKLDPASLREAEQPVERPAERLGEYQPDTEAGVMVAKGEHWVAAFGGAPGRYRANVTVQNGDGGGVFLSDMSLHPTPADAMRHIRETVDEGLDKQGLNDVRPPAPEPPTPGAAPAATPEVTAPTPADLAGVSPYAHLNPLTGDRDWTLAPEMVAAQPTRLDGASPGDVHAYLDSESVSGMPGPARDRLLADLDWETALVAPGGGVFIARRGHGAGYEVFHSLTGSRISYLPMPKADARAYAEALTRGITPIGRPIDWDKETPKAIAAELRTTFGDSYATEVRSFGFTPTIARKLAGGQFTGEGIKQAVQMRAAVESHRVDDSRWPNRSHAENRASELIGHLATLLHDGKRNGASWADEKRTDTELRDDGITVRTADVARRVVHLGAPDRAIAMLERRADELDAEYGPEESKMRGTIMLRGAARYLRSAFGRQLGGLPLVRSLQVGDELLVLDENSPRGRRVLRVVAPARNDRRYNHLSQLSVTDDSDPSGRSHSVVVDSYGSLSYGALRSRDYVQLVDGEAAPEGLNATRERIDQLANDPAVDAAVDAARARLDAESGAVTQSRVARSKRTAQEGRAGRVDTADDAARRDDIEPEIAARVLGRQAQLMAALLPNAVELYDGEAPKSTIETPAALRALWAGSPRRTDIDDPRENLAQRAKWPTARLSDGGWFVTFGDGTVHHALTGLNVGGQLASQAAADRYASYLERALDGNGRLVDWGDVDEIARRVSSSGPDALNPLLSRTRARADFDEVISRGPRASKALLGSLPSMMFPPPEVTPLKPQSVHLGPILDAIGNGRERDFTSKDDYKRSRQARLVVDWAVAMGPWRPYDVAATLRDLADSAGDATIARHEYGPKLSPYDERGQRIGTVETPVADLYRRLSDSILRRNDPGRPDDLTRLRALTERSVGRRVAELRVNRAQADTNVMASVRNPTVTPEQAARMRDRTDELVAAVTSGGLWVGQVLTSDAQPRRVWQAAVTFPGGDVMTFDASGKGDRRLNIDADGSITLALRSEPVEDGPAGGAWHRVQVDAFDWSIRETPGDVPDLDVAGDADNTDADGDTVDADLDAPEAAPDDIRWVEFDRLVESGMPEADAYAEAFGLDVEQVRRDSAIARLRGDGYEGAGFDELARAAYRDVLDREYFDAEDAVNGVMLSREGESRGLNPRELWRQNEAYARRWASEELRGWWDEHGRLTFDEFREQVLRGVAGSRDRTTGDSFVR